MSDSPRRGRLFRDESDSPPPPEKPTPPPSGHLVRQTNHSLPPHDQSHNEPPDKSESESGEPAPVKKKRKKSKQQKQEDEEEVTKPEPASHSPEDDSTARSTMVAYDKQAKKHFGVIEKWLRFYGLTSIKEGRKRADVDLYRDTPVRFLGYSEEVGEALRPFIPLWVVRTSYLLTSVYILSDTMDKTVKVSEARWDSKKVRQREIEKVLIDTLAWQGLASIVIPGILINRTVYMILYVMGLKQVLPNSVKSLTTASICLALIPNVAKPIDNGVDYFLNQSLRKMLKRRPPPY